MHYQKPPLTIPQQIIKLKERGLLLGDEARVTQYLNGIGYYRLSAYFLPFIDRNENQTNHCFLADTEFEQVLQLYIFDRKLRLIVMEAMERIEVAIRTQWANELTVSDNDAHAYMKPELFKDPWKHQKNMAKVAGELSGSSETFVTHYLSKYKQPYLPPTWAMAETLSFGSLSHWYANTADNKAKGRIAKSVGIPTVETMEGVLHALTLVRNTCAHHSRLWNRQFTKPIPYIKRLSQILQINESQGSSGGIQKQPSKKLFNYLVVTVHMMKTIQPSTQWQERLSEHLSQLNSQQQAATGFPADWQTHSFWSGENE